jgi:hypothetical protein
MEAREMIEFLVNQQCELSDFSDSWLDLFWLDEGEFSDIYELYLWGA